MDVKVKNSGNGPDIGQHVDQNNQAHTFSITKNVIEDATTKDNAYNIGTGWIALTSATPSAVFFMKNDEDPVNGESDIVIDSIVISIDALGTTTPGDMCDIVIIKNPTAGTIVSNASQVTYRQNRSFGSPAQLGTPTLTYKGAEGYTLTDGTAWGLLGQNVGTRTTYPLGILLSRGSSVGITIDTNTSADTTSVYIAIVCHRKDGKNS